MKLVLCMAVVCLGGGLMAAKPVIAERGVVSAGTAAAGSGVARGSAFVIRGAGLGPEQAVKGDVPFGAELGGVEVRLVSGETGEELQALLVEVSSRQIVAIAPSKLAAGDYQLSVTYGGETSESAKVKIADRNPGIVTTTISNGGMAVAVAGEEAPHRVRYLQPAVAGQLVKVEAAGFGPAEDDAGFPGEQSKLDGATVVLGETEIPVDYAGRHPGKPGYDQLVFRLPAEGIAPSCVVPLWLKVGEYRSEPAFLAMGESAETPCVHPGGLDEIALRELEKGGKIIMPGFQIGDSSMEFNFDGMKFEMRSRGIAGAFEEYDQHAIDRGGLAYFSRYAKNGCQVVSYDGGEVEFGLTRALDAGEKLFISGSSGFSNGLDRKDGNGYALDLPGSGLPELPLARRNPVRQPAARAAAILEILPGEYNLMGYGGEEIDEFLAQLKVSEPVAWSNRDAVQSIDRSSELQITWTPGPPSDVVRVTGIAGYVEAEGEEPEPRTVGVMFTCEAPADRGSIVVPADVLQRMPATAGREDAVSMLTVSHENKAPNGDFRAKTVSGKATEKGNFGFHYSWGKMVEFR